MFGVSSKDVNQVVELLLQEEHLDEYELVDEDLKVSAKESILETLDGKEFNQDLLDEWQDFILGRTLEKLQGLEKQFKFIVTCTIMEKLGGEIHSTVSAEWDQNTDKHCFVHWENDTIACVCSVTGLKI